MLWLAAASTSVLPSAGALAATAAPTVPPAPARFSTMALPPSATPSSLLKARATVSCTAPVPKGTMMWITRCCACAAPRPPRATAAASAASERRVNRGKVIEVAAFIVNKKVVFQVPDGSQRCTSFTK
ncbi:hypothetical protein D9M72_254760 [compost metagenome]